MATLRERPYGQFNFRVEITDINDATDATGGFQEVTGLGVEITVAEYRNGNDSFNYPQKIMGLSKTPDVTLKRGVIGDLVLHDWIDKIQRGESPASSSRPSPSSSSPKTAKQWRRRGSCRTPGP